MRKSTFLSCLSALSLIAVVLPACEDGAAGTSEGTLDPDSTGADVAVAQADAPADASPVDATADVAQVAETSQDTADNGPTGSADVAAEVGDVKPEVADVAADVKPEVAGDVAVDTAGEIADKCSQMQATFATLKAKAHTCTDFYQCYSDGPLSSTCTQCGEYQNGTSADTQNLKDWVTAMKTAGCTKSCPTACAELAPQVGICLQGACQTKLLPCKEIEGLAAQALAYGSKCTKDSECTFKVSNTLGCGCPTFLNMTTMGPGKPPFLFMTMLSKAYKANKCTTEFTCACADPQTAACVSGVCLPKN